MQKLQNFDQYGAKNNLSNSRGEPKLLNNGEQNAMKGSTNMQQYFHGAPNNRLNGMNNKGYVTSFDPQTFKSQPAPSSSRLKQRSHLTNGASNQIDLEPLQGGAQIHNLSSQNKREMDPAINPLQTTKALSNQNSKIQTGAHAGFLNLPRSQSRVHNPQQPVFNNGQGSLITQPQPLVGSLANNPQLFANQNSAFGKSTIANRPLNWQMQKFGATDMG